MWPWSYIPTSLKLSDVYCGLLAFIKKDFIYLFLERGEGREKERERNIDVREKHQSVAPCTWPIQGPNPQPKHVS